MIIGTCTVLIFVGETTLRTRGTFLTWSEKNLGRYNTYYGKSHDSWILRSTPNSIANDTFLEFDYEIRFNREGIRDIDHTLEKPEGLFRTYTNTWFKVLEKRLRAQRLLAYAPDLVILCFNTSDITDVILRGGWERFRADGTTQYREGLWFEPFYAVSHLVRYIAHVLFQYNTELIKKSDADSFQNTAQEELLSCMERFEGLAKQERFSLLLCTHPHPLDFAFPEKYFAPSFIQRLAQKTSHYMDLYDFMSAAIRPGSRDDYAWLDGWTL